MSKETEYFEYVEKAVSEFALGVPGAKLPEKPVSPNAQIIYNRAILHVSEKLVKWQDTTYANYNNYLEYFGAVSKEGAIHTSLNAKGDTVKGIPYLDADKNGVLQDWWGGGDDLKLYRHRAGDFAGAYAYAQATARVYNALSTGALPKESDKTVNVAGVKKALQERYDGYGKEPLVEIEEYDGNTFKTITKAQGNTQKEYKLPEGFKAQGFIPSAESEKVSAPKPTATPAPKPTTPAAPAKSTEEITFSKTESPSARAFNATFGFGSRDEGRGVIEGTFKCNGATVDLESDAFKKKVRTVYEKYHTAFDTANTSQARHAILEELSKDYTAHAKDKSTGGAEYLTALGIFNDAKDIRDLQKASPPQLETPRWTNWKEFRKNAEMIHFDLKAEYAPNTTVTQLHKNIDAIEAAGLELNGHIITGAGSINYIKVRDRMPDLKNSADLSAVVEPYQKAWGTGLTAQDTARRKEVLAELYDKYAKATSDEDKALYKHAIGSLGRSITHLSGLAKGMKAIPAYPTVAAYEADEQKSLAYAKSAYDAKQKGVTTPATTAPAEESEAPAVDASTPAPAPAAPAPKPKPTPKPKLKAGAEVTAQSGDSLSKLALRSDELMNTALELAKKGEIEGLAADASKRAVAGWVAGVIAKQSGIDDANVVTVGQKVKLPTADELKAAAKPPAPVAPPVKEPTQAEKEAAAKQRAAEEEKARKDAERLKAIQAEQERKNAEELKQKEAELDLKNRTVSDIRKYQALVDVVNLGGSRQNAIGDMVKKMKEYGLNGADNTQNLERAAAILLAASNGLENGASRTMSTSLLVPTDEQIQAGVKALNETVSSKDSKGGSIFKKGDGEEITPGELKASIPESVKKAVKVQAPGK